MARHVRWTGIALIAGLTVVAGLAGCSSLPAAAGTSSPPQVAATESTGLATAAPPASATPSATASRPSVAGSTPPGSTPKAATPSAARTPLPSFWWASLQASPSLPPSASTPLYSVSFTGPNGLVGGDGAIWTTANGGAGWARAWTGNERVTHVSAVGGGVAWATLTPRSATAALPDAVLRTSDGGLTWARQHLARPLAVHPTGARTAWAVTIGATNVLPPGMAPEPAPGQLLRTADGGATWNPVATPGMVDDVCLAGSLLWIAQGRHVWRSTDAGLTWAAHDPTLLRAEPQWVSSLGCAGDAVWLLASGGVGMNQQAYVVTRSLDRGSTWQVLYAEGYYEQVALSSAPPSLATIDAYAGPFAVVGPRVARFAGWCPACGYGSTTVVATDDGGATSRANGVPALYGDVPAAIAFADATDGWLIGSPTPVLLRTQDAGNSWRQVSLP